MPESKLLAVLIGCLILLAAVFWIFISRRRAGSALVLKEGDSKAMNEMTLDARIENVPKLTDYINAFLEERDCPLKAQMQIDVAVDEVFSNIAQYAYDPPESGQAVIGLDFDPDSRLLTLRFKDSGIPYNPLEKEDPDTSLAADEREIGGLGIFLIKKTMDDVLYAYENGQNILTLIKKI